MESCAMIVDGVEFCAEDTTDDQLRRGLAAAHRVLDEAGVTPIEARTADGQMNWASECELNGQSDLAPSYDEAGAAAWDEAYKGARAASVITVAAVITFDPAEHVAAPEA